MAWECPACGKRYQYTPTRATCPNCGAPRAEAPKHIVNADPYETITRGRSRRGAAPSSGVLRSLWASSGGKAIIMLFVALNVVFAILYAQAPAVSKQQLCSRSGLGDPLTCGVQSSWDKGVAVLSWAISIGVFLGLLVGVAGYIQKKRAQDN